MDDILTRQEWHGIVERVFAKLDILRMGIGEVEVRHSEFFRKNYEVFVFEEGELATFVDTILDAVDVELDAVVEERKARGENYHGHL